MRIGILGGTFDPFHRGHLDPVLAVREEIGWDRILYVPAHRQPFKLDRDSASGYHRFAMAVLATEAVDEVFVSSWELERLTTSYTVDTLEHLRERHPEATLDWIIGDDNLARLHEWKSIDRVLELANFVVLTREVEDRSPLRPRTAEGSGPPLRIVNADERGRSGGVIMARNPMIPISSTDVRRRVRAGEPIDAFVDPRVSRYIHHNALYQGETP